MRLDLLIYPVHAALWAAFAAGGWWAGRNSPGAEAVGAVAPAAAEAVTAPNSRAVLAVHFVAFAVLYQGIGQAVFPDRVVEWLPGQRILGTLVIAGGAALMAWARAWFHSWRFRAKLDTGHQLATGGPFAWVRHPIYVGLNLMALGSAIWVPNIFTWVGVALMAVGGDVRARAEERVLVEAFGDAYTAYARRTARFIPGVY